MTNIEGNSTKLGTFTLRADHYLFFSHLANNLKHVATSISISSVAYEGELDGFMTWCH